MSQNVPIVNAGLKYVNGLRVSWLSINTINVGSGACRDSSNVNDIVSQGDVIINGLVVGAGGMDVATVAAAKLYAIYAIGDSSGYHPASALASLVSVGSPSLPPGYDMYRRVGWVTTDLMSQFVKWLQYGSGQERHYTYLNPLTVAGAFDVAVFTEVKLDMALLLMRPAVPKTATKVDLILGFQHNSRLQVAPYDISLNGFAPLIFSAALDFGTTGVDVSTTLNATGVVSVGFSTAPALDVLGKCDAMLVSGFYEELE